MNIAALFQRPSKGRSYIAGRRNHSNKVGEFQSVGHDSKYISSRGMPSIIPTVGRILCQSGPMLSNCGLRFRRGGTGFWPVYQPARHFRNRVVSIATWDGIRREKCAIMLTSRARANCESDQKLRPNSGNGDPAARHGTRRPGRGSPIHRTENTTISTTCVPENQRRCHLHQKSNKNLAANGVRNRE
jgi:hypothetical protein